MSPWTELILYFIGLPGYSSLYIHYPINGNLGELETTVKREINFKNARRAGAMAVENPWVEETSGGPGTPKTPSHGVQVTWCFNSVFFFSESLPEDEFCPVLAPDPLRERRSVWNKRKSVRIQPFFWVITKRGRTRCSSPTGLILNFKGRLRNHYKNRF